MCVRSVLSNGVSSGWVSGWCRVPHGPMVPCHSSPGSVPLSCPQLRGCWGSAGLCSAALGPCSRGSRRGTGTPGCPCPSGHRAGTGLAHSPQAFPSETTGSSPKHLIWGGK